MKTILEVSPTAKITYTMDDYIYRLVTRIYDNYYTLYHKYPTVAQAISYLPKELSDTISSTPQPPSTHLAGLHYTLQDCLE